MIDRRNLLDLIGKNRGKYHSCILTCYSLDFSFFEERVLPVLRTVNIKNINVFADGKFLEAAQENTTGRELKFNKSYNFQAVYATGVFHPKIMLLTGVKHGLLIIGSGNITSSGLNTNDEIWGAFQLDNFENDNASLFGSVWEYLNQFTRQTYGFIPQKMQWITKYSPWLLELPKGKKSFDLISLNQNIQFIYNSIESSIYNQITDSIPKENLSEITVISPYYDINGEFITQLYKHYNPIKFNCVLDVNYGLLPTGISETMNDYISFYDWKICKKDFDTKFNRLHAKILHFQYNDGREIMILGSANATKAAMGIDGISAVNHEAVIIIKRISKINWLMELGIEFPKETIKAVKELKTNLSSLYPKEPTNKYQLKIVYSELRANEISIYIDNKLTDKYLKIVSISRTNEIIEQNEAIIEDDCIKVICDKPDNLFKIYIINMEGIQLSNFSITHRLESLIKCNPDPHQEKLDYLLEQDYPDGEGITELLQYADFNWADEEIKVNNSSSRSNFNSHDTNTDSLIYSKLNAKDFNTVSNDVLLKQAGELSNSSVKIVDFLKIVSSDGSFISSNDFIESSEQSLLEDTEQKGIGDKIENVVKSKITAEKEQRAIINYFKKLNDLYNDKLQLFYINKSLKDTPKEEITLKLLSNILIGLQLIHIYHGKKYTIEKPNELNKEITLIEKTYLKEGDLNSDLGTIKGFLFEVFGKFLLLSTGSMKTYDYEILVQKLNHNRKETFVKSLFIMMNINWKEKEIENRDILILNTLFFMNPNNLTAPDFISNLKNSINKIKVESKFISNSFATNLENFCDIIFPKYIDWYKSYSNDESKKALIVDVADLKSSSIIFSKYLGFNSVNKVHKKANGSFSVDLKREGYLWNEDVKMYITESIDYPLKCIKY